MARRSLSRSIRDLCLALLNATLILAALCLWFAWGALSAADRVSTRISEAAQSVLPLRDEIATLTTEIAAARADLTTLPAGGAEAAALQARLSAIEMRLAELSASVSTLTADPDALIDRAVSSAFAGLGDAVAQAIAALRATP